MKYESFLKWWLVFTLIIIGFVFCSYIGVFRVIWEKDASYLSFATLALFFVSSIQIGTSIFNLSSEKDLTKEKYESYGRKEEIGWFVSEVCLNLGMLGTIIGFVMMLSGFDGLDISNQKTIQGLLSELGKSMATALYTTLVGLVCGQLLKLQTFILSLHLNKLDQHEDKKTV